MMGERDQRIEPISAEDSYIHVYKAWLYQDEGQYQSLYSED